MLNYTSAAAWNLNSLQEIIDNIQKLMSDKKSLSREELEPLLAIPDFKNRVLARNPELKVELENLDKGIRDKPITHSTLIESTMKAWFKYQESIAMHLGKLPDDGSDIKEAYHEFAEELGVAMFKSEIDRVTPQNTEIWQQFFASDDQDLANARNVCPLIKEGDSYRFMGNLKEYFAMAKMAKEDIDNDNTSKSRPD